MLSILRYRTEIHFQYCMVYYYMNIPQFLFPFVIAGRVDGWHFFALNSLMMILYTSQRQGYFWGISI